MTSTTNRVRQEVSLTMSIFIDPQQGSRQSLDPFKEVLPPPDYFYSPEERFMEQIDARTAYSGNYCRCLSCRVTKLLQNAAQISLRLLG